MALPRVRWVAGRKTSLQDRLRRRTAATGHRCINNLNTGIPTLVNIEQSIQCSGLASRGPPGKDFQLVFACSLCRKRCLQYGADDSERRERGTIRHFKTLVSSFV